MNPVKQIWEAIQVVKETYDVMTVFFDTPGVFSYKPGQFVNVTFDIEEKKVTRSYSLSSLFGQDEHPSITIKRLDGGLLSSYVFNNIDRLTKWEIKGPFGNFSPLDTVIPHVVLFAGGVGITPLLPIARKILEVGRAQVLLVYSTADADSAIFKMAVDSLCAHPNFTVMYVESLAKVSAPGRVPGRLNRVVLKKLLKISEVDLSKAHFYLCGPGGLLRLYKETLSSLSVGADVIFSESFSLERNDEERHELPRETFEVLVHVNAVTQLIEVKQGNNILDAALASSMNVPYSCRAGNCGRCYGKVVSGKVEMKRNYALTADEVDAGYALLCQSHPLTSDVVIEINR